MASKSSRPNLLFSRVKLIAIWVPLIGLAAVFLSSCSTTPSGAIRSSPDPNAATRAVLERLHQQSSAERERILEELNLQIETPPWPDFQETDWELVLEPSSRAFANSDAVQGEGIGVPVVFARENDASIPLDAYRPPEGIFRSATAVLEEDGGQATLRFLDPKKVTTYKGQPLAYNLTESWGMLMDRAGKLKRSGRKLMLNPASFEREIKIYLLDPYDPDRIPLLMVHGLQSTPVAWAELVNALNQDPVVRAHYQVWQFHYPTNAPVLHHAHRLRRELAETLSLLDPKGDDLASGNIVVVGHSMGGVISHTLVSESGDKVWDAFATRPLEQLQTTDTMREILEGDFFFEPNPAVRRVVFIASPHRGADMADGLVGDLGNFLAKPASAFEEASPSSLEALNPGAIRPKVLTHYGDRKLTSIRTLSKNGILLQALAELPPVVPIHSIIAQKNPGPIEEGHDGVVDYPSAHFPAAESEIIVRSNHNGAVRSPETANELVRILRLHVGE